MQAYSAQDPESGDMFEGQKPSGFFCVRCLTGATVGFGSYATVDQVRQMVLQNPDMKTLVGDVTDAVNNPDGAASHPGVEDVTSCRLANDKLVALFDGYERGDFLEAFEGMTPESAGVPGIVETNPRSGMPVTLYYVPAKPAFRLEMATIHRVVRSSDRMPQQVYHEQPDHTYDFLSQRLPSAARQGKEPPPRREILKAMRTHISRHSQGGAAASSASTVPSSRSLFAIPVNPSQPSRPQTALMSPLAKQHAMLMAQVSSLRPPPAVIENVVPAPRAVFPSSRAPVSMRPPTPTTPNQQAKRRRTSDAAAERAAILSSPSGAVDFVNLRALSASPGPPQSVESDGSSTVAPELKGLNKFERAKAKCSLANCFVSPNMETEFTHLRRTITVAQRESPTEWYGKLKAHLQHMTAACEANIDRMIMHVTFEPILGIATVLVSAGFNRLPKIAFVDVCLVGAAMAHLQPFQKESDLHAIMARLTIKGNTATYEISPDSDFNCTYMDDDDLKSGIVPSRVVYFIQKYILAPLLRQGKGARLLVVDFIEFDLLPWIGVFETFAGFLPPCMVLLKNRGLALLFLLGDIPFQNGCSISNVPTLKARGPMQSDDGSLYVVLQEVPWLSSLMDKAYLMGAGEKKAWPEVEAAMVAFSKSDQANALAIVDDILKRYAAWRQVCRETSLPSYVHPPVLALLSEEIDKCVQIRVDSGEKAFEEAIQTEGSKGQKLLQLMTEIDLLQWPESKVKEMKGKLEGVGSILSMHANMGKMMEALAAFPTEAGAVTLSNLGIFADAFVAAMPPHPAKLVFKDETFQNAIGNLELLAPALLAHYPGDEDSHCFKAANCIIEQMEFSIVKVEENQQRCLDLMKRLKTFQRLMKFHLDYKAFTANSLNAETVENMELVQLAKRLIWFGKHFQAENPEGLSEAGRAEFEECMTKSTEAITHFKLFFVQNAKNPLSTAIGHLNAKAGGGDEGQSWKQSIDPSWSFSQFKASVGSTLGSVDVIQIVSLIKEVDTATLN